jgi:hypothetical protein
MSARVEVRVSIVGLVIALGAGCAAPHAVTIERRPDGITHLTCKSSLQVCLGEAEALCGHRSYAVTRAFDSHELKGDSTYPLDVRTSEAFVCCVLGSGWGDQNHDPMAAPLCQAPPPAVSPATPTAAPATPPSRACTPGASQACVGPAGCKGGQVCAPDGAAFGACDCGSAPAAAP